MATIYLVTALRQPATKNMEQEAFQVMAIALALGLLVGLQRQHANSQLAGIRTFPLITLLGALTGLLAPAFGPWAMLGGFAGIPAPACWRPSWS